MSRIVFLLSLLAMFGCQQKYQLQRAEQIAEETRLAFAPDKRVALFRIDSLQKGKPIVAMGETNLPEAKQFFFEKLKQEGIIPTDRLELLPAADLNGKHFGVVNVSVCNIRSEPRHSAELATQALMGSSLRVWKKNGDFYLVQTTDDYFGWLDGGAFKPMNKVEHEQWLSSRLAIITLDNVYAFERKDQKSAKVTDLMAGNIVQIVENQGDFTLVALPDAIRFCFVPNQFLTPLSDWLKSRNPTAENILVTAKEMMGRPYLWGGTSGKGMDCSGFTKMAFLLNGIQLPRDASQQVNVGALVDTDTATLKNLLPGDLLFFGRPATPEKKERVSHVAFYLGDGKIIHASDRVKIESLRRGEPDFVPNRLASFIRAKRIIGQEGKNGVLRLTDLPYFQFKP
ncbi:MAG: C40 family peptidase [Saprospiraceae bacterium]|nr:C40 family peptidase [Saprospiraceae bacterium]